MASRSVESSPTTHHTELRPNDVLLDVSDPEEDMASLERSLLHDSPPLRQPLDPGSSSQVARTTEGCDQSPSCERLADGSKDPTSSTDLTSPSGAHDVTTFKRHSSSIHESGRFAPRHSMEDSEQGECMYDPGHVNHTPPHPRHDRSRNSDSEPSLPGKDSTASPISHSPSDVDSKLSMDMDEVQTYPLRHVSTGSLQGSVKVDQFQNDQTPIDTGTRRASTTGTKREDAPTPGVLASSAQCYPGACQEYNHGVFLEGFTVHAEPFALPGCHRCAFLDSVVRLNLVSKRNFAQTVIDSTEEYHGATGKRWVRRTYKVTIEGPMRPTYKSTYTRCDAGLGPIGDDGSDDNSYSMSNVAPYKDVRMKESGTSRSRKRRRVNE